MRPLASLLFALLAVPALADITNLPWWRLELKNQPQLEGEEPRVLLTLKAAREMLERRDGDQTWEPEWLKRVDFEKWMIVIVPCAARDGEAWDVERVTAGKILEIHLMRQADNGRKGAATRGSMAILMERFDPAVRGELQSRPVAIWVEGDLEAMRAKRDCVCKPPAEPKGKCGVCGAEAARGADDVCEACHRMHVCGMCKKRVLVPVPLKEEKK